MSHRSILNTILGLDVLFLALCGPPWSQDRHQKVYVMLSMARRGRGGGCPWESPGASGGPTRTGNVEKPRTPRRTRRSPRRDFSKRAPGGPRQHPRNRFIPNRFLTVLGPAGGAQKPRTARNLPSRVLSRREVWERRETSILGGGEGEVQGSKRLPRSLPTSFSVFSASRGPQRAPGPSRK